MIVGIWRSNLGGCEFQRFQRLLIEFTRDLKAASDLKTCNGCRCFTVVFPSNFPVEEAVRFERFFELQRFERQRKDLRTSTEKAVEIANISS